MLGCPVEAIFLGPIRLRVDYGKVMVLSVPERSSNLRIAQAVGGSEGA